MRNLELIGIKKTWDYRLGDWFGNSTYSGYQVFRYVTHNISDLLQRSLFQYKSGKKIVCQEDFKKCLKVREIGHRTYGRCFEFETEVNNAQEQDTIFFVDIQIKRPIYIFFNLPNLFSMKIQDQSFRSMLDRIFSLMLLMRSYKIILKSIV